MPFSLKKLVTKDLNPFDGPGKPRPASTAQAIPQQMQYSPVAQQRILARNPSTGAQQIARGVTTTEGLHAVQQPNIFKQNAQALGLGAARTGLGLVQGVSGLVDLASPGTGVSTVSRGANNLAVKTDQAANRAGVNAGYRTIQAPLNVATFLTPSVVADVAGFGGKAAQATKVGKFADQLATHGAPGRIAGTTVKGTLNKSNVLNAAGMTGLQTGTNASKGGDTSPLGTAEMFGTNLAFGGGLAGGGQAALEGARLGIKGAQAGVRAVTPHYAGLPAKQVIMDTNKLDTLHAALQAPDNVESRQGIINGLHQIKNDHGLDFISGSPAARKQRIAQYLEQNGEAIPQLQAHQAKRGELRNTAIDIGNKYAPGLRTNAVNDAGEQLGMNGKPLKASSEGSIAPELQQRINDAQDFLKNPNVRGGVRAKAERDLADLQRQATPPVSSPSTKLVTPRTSEAVPPQRPVTTKLVAAPGESSLVKNSGFASGAQRSAEVSDPTKKIIKQNQPTYKQRNTKQLAAEADAFANRPKNLKEATDDVNERLASPEGQIDDRTVADAIAVAKAHDAKGNHDVASSIYEGLSGHLTKQGQSIQAASLLSNRTPEGLKLQATRTLKKGKVDMTPELQAKLETAFKKVKSTKEGSDERFRAAQEYAKIVADSLPTSVGDKVAAFWKAGLLTGIKTQTGNALSNATFGVLHGASNPMAAAIDAALSLKTGVRTKSFTTRGYGSGVKEGAKAAKGVLKTGIDERPGLANKYDQSGATFGNQHGEVSFGNSAAGKAAKVYVNGVFRLMGAADRPAYYAQLRNSLADLGKAEGITKGLKGKELSKFVDDFVKNPPKSHFQTATNEAEKAVLANDTFLSNVANKARRAAGEIDNPLGREAAKLGLNVVAPFTKVPSAFISRVLDYTPVGAIKEVATQAAAKQLDQRALSTALSEATTGTALIYLGTTLAQNGLISGNYPNDPKEQARWKAEGVQPNSVKVDGSWKSLNYFGPLGSLFSQGKRASDVKNEGGSATDVATGFTGGAVQDALGQSFLQGVSGALDAIQDPKRYAANYTRNQAGSIIPTLSKDVAEATDPMQRDTNTPGQAIQARIPGVRQGLPVKQDVYGNKLDRKTNALGTLVDPFRSSKAITNDVKSEVARLHDTDTTNKDLQVTPTPIDKSVSVEGKKVKLTDKQRYAAQEIIGQTTQKLWGELIKTPEYQALDDVDKAQALSKLRTDVNSAMTRKYIVENGLATYAKASTARQNRIMDGSVDVASYTGSKAFSSSKTASSKSKSTKTKTAKTKSTGRKSGGRKGSGGSKTAFGASLRAMNATNRTSDKALRDLVNRAKVSSKSGKQAKVTQVALKKQDKSKYKSKVKVA